MANEPSKSLFYAEEQAALDHVKECIAQNGQHSTSSCPYPARAMCRYRRVLKTLAARGVEVPTR